MVYRDYDKLSIITLEKAQEAISLDVLKAFMRKRPANVVYVELDGYLYGLFSMGSVRRAIEDGKNEVKINRNFTKIGPGKYMQALQIFHDRDTINAIPIVTSDNVLLGEYSRWDDSIVLSFTDPYSSSKIVQKYEKEFWSNRSLVLIKPYSTFDWTAKQFERWKEYFERMGAIVQAIEWEEALDYSYGEDAIVLFADEDQERVVQTLKCDCRFDAPSSTYARYLKDFAPTPIKKNIELHLSDKFLKNIQDKGIHVLNLTFHLQNTPYCAKLSNEIEEKYKVLGKEKSNTVYPEFYPNFFAELYTPKYAEAIISLNYEIILTEGTYKLKDIQSSLLNVENNERRTVGQPSECSQEVFFVGPCFVYGLYVEDQYTIESFLQKKFNDSNLNVRVRNLGAPANVISSYLNRISETDLHKNDIIITYMENNSCTNIPNLNLVEALEENEIPAEWMVDDPFHVNHKINALYADTIYEKLAEHFVAGGPAKTEQEPVCIDSRILEQTYFETVFSDFDGKAYNRVGAIVMNCNPFTKGHRYLIEQALGQVDFLIIFVVEEDKSLFPFDMRFAFVKAGTADLENVMVVPSGDFILSQTTFPEYFIKIKDEDIIQNVEYDITLFAERIAPHLNITTRFVGEEPDDDVTREYNEAMKRILPPNGIGLVEIPRLELENGQVVSGTAARKCLEDNDMEMLDCLVPPSTKRILLGEHK